ncbi:hemerythrin domain-containing protein, partial [Clostridioides difficile]|uniref:hemerythrin domain-containing protein n=1 Tax=Clostridioides difficile TaxID=1496 RepID=UPI0018DD378F
LSSCMLHKIGTGKSAATTGPLDMLLACHDRLRHFSELASLLASRPDASADDVVDAARRLCTYFTVALPLHEADEEISVSPRLLSSSNGESVAEALA